MCAQDRNTNIGLAHKVDIRTSDEVLVPEQICFANLGLAHKVDIRTSYKVLVPEQICFANLGLAHKVSDDLKVPLHLPVSDRIQPLAPFPVAGGGEMVDEAVAEPVAGDVGLEEVAVGLCLLYTSPSPRD